MGIFIQEQGPPHSETIVFLHGAGLSSWMWNKQVQYFANQYHCLTIDLPEQGQSNGTEPFSMRSSAAMVAEVIRQNTKDGKAHCIGFSLGAQVLVQMLADFPEVLHSVIINSALVKPMPTELALTRIMAPLMLPLVRMRLYARIQAQALGIPPEYFDAYFRDSVRIAGKDVFMRIMNENLQMSIPKKLAARPEIPTLLLYGQHEPRVMQQSAEALHERLPYSHVKIISGAKHGFNLTMPDIFNGIIDEFLSGRM